MFQKSLPTGVSSANEAENEACDQIGALSLVSMT